MGKRADVGGRGGTSLIGAVIAGVGVGIFEEEWPEDGTAEADIAVFMTVLDLQALKTIVRWRWRVLTGWLGPALRRWGCR